jgi:hypothetical protein
MEHGSLHDVLATEGYKLIDDAWSECRRRTYHHNEAAARAHINSLAVELRHLGWSRDRGKLRAFCHLQASELIEIEPGGPDTSGHFLHHTA